MNAVFVEFLLIQWFNLRVRQCLYISFEFKRKKFMNINEDKMYKYLQHRVSITTRKHVSCKGKLHRNSVANPLLRGFCEKPRSLANRSSQMKITRKTLANLRRN